MGSRSQALWRQAFIIALCFVGAAAVSWLRALFAGTLRLDDAPIGWPARIGLGLVFGILVIIAGIYYLRAIRASSGQSLRGLGLAALLIHAAGLLALPFTSNDLFSNLAYGRLAALGINPYLGGPGLLGPGDPFAAMVGSRWLDAPTVYGPILTALSSLIGRSGSLVVALVVFKLVLFACSLAAVALVWHLCRQLPRERAAPTFVLFAWNPLLVWELTAQAHNDGVMVVALLAFVAAARDERTLLATLSLTVALWSKFAAAPLAALWLVFLLHRSRWQALAAAGIIAVGGVLLVLPYWSGLATLSGPLLAAGGNASRTDNSLASLLCLLAQPAGRTAQHLVYELCRDLGTALLLFLGLRALRRAHSLEQILHDGLIIFLVYALVAAPWFQPWYLSWMMPLLLLERDPQLQRTIVIYSLLAIAQYTLPLGFVGMLMVHLWTLQRLFRSWGQG
jgi:hypothetical protein